MDAGMAQTTAAVKLITDAVQAERTEFSKVWERGGRPKPANAAENLTRPVSQPYSRAWGPYDADGRHSVE